uniref:Uncharacterized protein n=1 Tax=Tetranychus urticae TaxID=32264 RepID=T1KR81_TETUR
MKTMFLMIHLLGCRSFLFFHWPDKDIFVFQPTLRIGRNKHGN